eukprot:scaffold206533_cov30-Tisochrysis_lutea.AAC.3
MARRSPQHPIRFRWGKNVRRRPRPVSSGLCAHGLAAGRMICVVATQGKSWESLGGGEPNINGAAAH